MTGRNERGLRGGTVLGEIAPSRGEKKREDTGTVRAKGGFAQKKRENSYGARPLRENSKVEMERMIRQKSEENIESRSNLLNRKNREVKRMPKSQRNYNQFFRKEIEVRGELD